MAAILIRRNAARKSLSGTIEEDEDVDTRPMYLRVFPCEASISKDLKLGLLLGRYLFCVVFEGSNISIQMLIYLFFDRNWQDRRVSCTKDVIAFARVNESILLDAIPLSEVTTIEVMKTMDQSDKDKQAGQYQSGYDNVIDFTHAFQIRTKQNGQNAGRKYVLRASSNQEVTTIISHLNHLAKLAAEKAEARSGWGKLQNQIRLVSSAAWFQGISSFLIIAVG